jgi:hypothetical protein
MTLNKYRYLEYADDGCSVYECMSCKAQWEVRSVPTVYCGNCGIKFDGKHECRSCRTPRWEYERFDGSYDPPYFRYGSDERKAYEAAKAKEKVWVIQKRITLLESEYGWDYESDAEPFPRVGEWKDEYRSDRPAWLHPAKEIHAKLVRHRKSANDLAEAEAYTQRIEKKQLCETVTEAGGDVSEWGPVDRVTVEKFDHRVITKFRGDARGSVIYYRER